MKVKCLSYRKIFPIASFINETIGIEVELDETDNPDEVFAQIKAKVNEWGAGKSNYELVDRNPPLPVQQVEKTTGTYKVEKKSEQPVVTLEDQIRSCESLNVLGIYEKIIDKEKDTTTKTKLWLLYDEKYTQLSNLQPVK